MFFFSPQTFAFFTNLDPIKMHFLCSVQRFANKTLNLSQNQ